MSMLLTGVGSSGFNPLSLNPALLALPEDSFSDAGITPAVDNDPVYQVDDSSANNNDPIQAVLASRPIYKSAGYWQFDGANDSFSIGTIAITLPVSCYAVVDTASLGTADRIFLERSPAGLNTPAFYIGRTGADYAPYVYWNGSHASGSTIQSMQIIRWKLDGTKAYTRQNNNTEVESIHGQTLGTVDWVSINNSSVQQSNINLYEFILFNGTTISSDDDDRIFAYLNNKYSVY